jgi:hypothetical protein
MGAVGTAVALDRHEHADGPDLAVGDDFFAKQRRASIAVSAELRVSAAMALSGVQKE